MKLSLKSIFLVAVPGFVSYFEATMVISSIPTISHQFIVSPAVANYIILIYVVVEVLLFVPMSFIAERIGLRKIFSLGVIILGMGGLLIPTATQFNEVLILRIIQGIGASIVVPSTLSFASLLETDQNRGKVVGIIAASVGIGYGVGLPLGGGVLHHWVGISLYSVIVYHSFNFTIY